MSSRTSRAAAQIRDPLRAGGDQQIPDESAARLSGMTYVYEIAREFPELR
jgi:hypothetical protein